MAARLSVAQAIVGFLEAQKIAHVFGVPGESYLGVLDALHDSDIRFVNARQEGGAAMMAEATGKLTGKPGICMVTRGPGATNASAGVHVAQQDSTPMILFVGQIARQFEGRDAFQEVNYQNFFGGMVKGVLELNHAERVYEQLFRAWSLAIEGRPGPVVVVLPEDVLDEQVNCEVLLPYRPLATPRLPDGAVADILVLLEQAKQPVAIIGDLTFDHEFDDTTLTQRLGMPLIASFRRQGSTGPWLAGYGGDLGLGTNPALVQRVREADLLLLLNEPFSEIPSQSYGLVPGANGQKVIQVLPAAAELGRWFQPDFGLVGKPSSLLNALVDADFVPKAQWRLQAKQAEAEFSDWQTSIGQHPGAVQMPEVVAELKRQVSDAVMCNGAGNYATWLHRFWRYKPNGQVAPLSGSMGYGLPAAIAAQLVCPDKRVICWAGDGCLQMTIQEMATAVEQRQTLIVLLIDNGMYGTIRMHQERHFPSRISGTIIENPDFCAIAEGYGWQAHRVDETKTFRAALQQSLDHHGPSLIRVMLDPEAITPSKTLTEVREGF